MPRVRCEPSGREVDVPAGSTLLEAILAAGLPIARSCGADGVCGRCGVRVLAGAAHVDAESLGEAEVKRCNGLDPELRLACRVRLRGEITVTAAYW